MNSFSHAADRNKEPILEVLSIYLSQVPEISEPRKLLEVGSGTGQHAVFFANHFKGLQWVTSDLKDKHLIIKQALNEAQLKNVRGPENLQLGVDDFPKGIFHYVFTANTLHIISWKEAKTLFKLLGKRLRQESLVFIYGPFNYNNSYTSESNKEFDLLLKKNNAKSGIRNFEDVEAAMLSNGFKLVNDHSMPANNKLLVFERLAFKR